MVAGERSMGGTEGVGMVDSGANATSVLAQWQPPQINPSSSSDIVLLLQELLVLAT